MWNVRILLLFGAFITLANGQSWPGSVVTNATIPVAVDHSITTLTTAVGPTDLTIPVASSTNFQPFEIVNIDSEQLQVCAVNSGSLGICANGRGYAGTISATHSAQATVFGYVDAIYHNSIFTELAAVENWLTTTALKDPGSNGVVKRTAPGTTAVATASDLAYTAAGSGAVTSTVGAKLGEGLSVKDFGATGNGGTDDTSAMQKAVAAAAASGGDQILVPCGTYVMSGTMTINTPSISLVGENANCSVIKYTGTTRPIIWQMSPFTTKPAGTIKNLTITGTAAATEGILSGQIVAGVFENLVITGFTGVNASGIHLHNAGNFTTWTERNDFINVSLGGVTANPYNTYGILMDSDNVGDSFGYNRFIDAKFNVSTNQIGVFLASGFFYNSIFNMICNSDNVLAGSTGALCVRSSGNWDSNASIIDGEWANGGIGTGTAYSVQVDVGGKFNGWGHVSVFGPSSTSLTVNNLAGASTGASTVTLRESETTSWDTGTYTLSGVPTAPNPTQREQYGSMGLLLGNNVESPYVSMFNSGGNQFVIGSVDFGTSLGSMNTLASFDTLGDLYTSGKVWAGGTTSGTADANYSLDLTGRALIRGDNAPGGGQPKLPVTAGYRTNAAWAGGANVFLTGTTGINEQIQLNDQNGEAGIGSSVGTNVAHPVAWCYNLDTDCLSVYAKSFQTPISGTPIFNLTEAGNMTQSGNKITLNGSSGAFLQFGTGVPGGSCPSGSLYTNSTGAAGTTLYVCVSSSWSAVTIP